MQYKITVQDIKDYLASLAPTEQAGNAKTTTGCLVARALTHKYGGEEFDVGYKNFTVEGSTKPYPIDEHVLHIIYAFDDLGRKVDKYPTREQVEQAIPVLKGE